MKRILLMGGINNIGDYPRNIAVFKAVMFHGDIIGVNGQDILFKNTFNMKSIFQPGWSFVVAEEVKQILDGVDDFELKKLKETRFFEFDYFKDCTKEEKKISKAEKSNYRIYYESIKFWPNESLDLYLLSLPRIIDLTGKFEPVRIKIPDLDATFLIHAPEIEKIPYYNGFKYNGFTFFKYEVFEKFERFIDKDFFVIKEVDIPIESVSINKSILS